jgi:hypothetical protein
VCQHAIADHQPGQFGCLGWHAAPGAQFLQLGIQALVLDDAALADQVEKFVNRTWRWHQPTFSERSQTNCGLGCSLYYTK